MKIRPSKDDSSILRIKRCPSLLEMVASLSKDTGITQNEAMGFLTDILGMVIEDQINNKKT